MAIRAAAATGAAGRDLRLRVSRRSRRLSAISRWVTRKRYGDHRALRRPPLNSKAYSSIRRSGLECPPGERLNRLLPRLVLVRAAMQLDRFDNLIPNRMHRAKGRHRLLEDQADFASRIARISLLLGCSCVKSTRRRWPGAA